MSFMIIRGERFALELGRTVLGGRSDDALPSDATAELPPFAVVDYPLDGPTTVAAIEARGATINGAPLRAEPVALQHGDRLVFSGLAIAFGDIRSAGRTNNAAPVTEECLATGVGASPTDSTGGRLTRLADGTVYDIPAHGLTIGRDPDSDLVVASKDASRRHASISPSLLGYTLTDQSANGVAINGARVESIQILNQGDVIRVAGDDFRFDANDASFAPAFAVDEIAPPATPSAPVPRQAAAATLLASLEVLADGESKGRRFRIEQPALQIGRGPHNDITLASDSVSGSHASLALHGHTWHVRDHGSRNGTFVDGQVVREQRPLPDVCKLRLGSVTLLFRAINAVIPSPAAPVKREGNVEVNGTIGVIGLTDEQLG